MNARARRRTGRAAGGAAVVALALLPGCALDTSREAFFAAYLYGYLFWLGVSLGALALLMVHHLVGGAWGFLMQRPLEAAAATLPVLGVLFVPIALGMHDLYHWTHAEAVAADPILQHKAPYLNTTFFLVRAGVYFAAWSTLTFLLRRWSRPRDAEQAVRFTARAHASSGPGLVVYVLTTSFAAIDWAMSLDPHWFSTIYGFIFVVGQGLSAFAFMIAILPWLGRDAAHAAAATPDRLHSLGKLMFAFTMLWGYVHVSQFIIVWMANLPEELPWYLHRTHGAWLGVTVAVVCSQFVGPFFLLLSRSLKRNRRGLVAVALLVLAARALDMFWLLRPSEHHAEPHVQPYDVLSIVGLGVVWIAVFAWTLRRAPLLPTSDPRFAKVMHGH